ncbi:hypothetical protein RIF29_35088 [Crotalaria pallida]|uniref:RING-type E3 ubiquitin transferase n=1 Tax=Crotalaria pallida TaxID=3830 RepID=A0AAN9EC75_CROPI
MKWRKPRNQINNITETTTDPNPQISSLTQSTTCKTTISSLFTSTFSSNNEEKNKKKTNFSAASSSFRRSFGCTAGASQQVSVPAVIRSSADWQGKKKKSRKKKHKNISSSSSNNNNGGVLEGSNFQDVWCGPGIGFSTDAAVASSVDCAVTRKNVSSSSSRGKIDVDKITTHRERPSYLGRRTVIPETISFLDSDPDIFGASESFGPAATYYRHIRDPSSDDSPDVFAEIMTLQGSLVMGGRLTHDQFRDWRLDIDNMSYEQLLDLGERIGYVNTGLKEDEMRHGIRKTKFQFSDDASKHQVDKKCSICQDEYEANDELGKLNCGHNYHFQCIKQWVAHKNFCPVCKQQVVARH